MRYILRSIVYSFLALKVVDIVIGSFRYDGDYTRTFILVLIAFSLLNLFMTPILHIISMPTNGIPYLFVSFLITLLMVYVTTVFVPGFSVVESVLPETNLFGFVLPAKDLTQFWSLVFSSLLTSLTFDFFTWLSERKK